jgi:hypothetical protein
MKPLVAVAALALVSVACMPAADHSNAPAPEVTFLVPDDDELHALLVSADAEWEAAGVAPGRLIVGQPGDAGGVPVAWRSTAYVSEKCMPNGGTAIGCLDRRVRRPARNARADRPPLLGHTLRGIAEEWHVSESACAEDRAAATMCDKSVSSTITEADADFICGSETAPCE